MTQGYYSPQANYYQNQMRNIVGGYNYSYPVQNFQPATAQPPLNQFPCRAVGSIEEARGAILDNLTIPYLFTNFPNNEIYVKYTDNTTGQAKTVVFVPKVEEVKETKKENGYFEEKIKELEAEIKSLNNEILLIKGGLSYVQPANDTDVKDVTKPNGRNAKNVQQ